MELETITTVQSKEDEEIKKLTEELCSLDCKNSRYRLRSEQILFEINKLVKAKNDGSKVQKEISQ